MPSDEKKKITRDPTADQDASPGLAGLWARHGNKLLIGLTAALLIFWAVRYRQRQEAERQSAARDSLANAWVALDEFRVYANQPHSTEVDRQLSQAEAQINGAVQLVLDDPKADPVQAAWAWVARGELYWSLAHRPDASPTTAPTSAPASQPANDPLALARNAYEQVVNHFTADPTALTIARFGLAAVAEEKGDLNTAREQYKKLIETPNFASALSPQTAARFNRGTMAEERLKRLNELEKPLLLLPATRPVTAAPVLPPVVGPAIPELQPSTMAPATTAPTSTVPAATAPATPPATTRP